MKKYLNKGASPPCISPAPEGCSVRFVAQLELDQSFLKKFAPFALCVLLAACSSGPPVLPNQEPALRQLSETGYVPKRKYGTTTLRENWGSPDARIDVSVIAPSSAGDVPFPLVVYLPGLGEPATAGQLWRKAWAEAGYSVVSIQPAALTEEIWGSRQAREGDFQGMAREKYTVQESIARLRMLDTALAEIRRRAAAGTAPYSQADPTNIVLAGFELGAYTASLAAGERMSGTAGERVSGAAGERVPVNTPARKPDIRALITLSPYYNRNTTDAEARYEAMSLPVLAITGSDDDDPFHLVRDPELRKSPWRLMPSGAKYLLSITGGTHTMLAGDGFYDTNISREQSDADEAARKREQQRGMDPPSGQRRRRFDEPRLDAIPGSMNADQSDRGARGEQASRDESNLRRLRPVKIAPIPFNLNHLAAVTSVSTAFLDAHLRSDARARKWLSEDAARWLGAASQLQLR